MKKTCKSITLLTIMLLVSSYVTFLDASFAGEKTYPVGGAVTGKVAKYFQQWINHQLALIKSGNAPLKPELWVIPKNSFAHANRNKMIEITNSALTGGTAPTVESMLQQGYIILKSPVFCRVVESKDGSAIVYALAIDTTTGAAQRFYTHCNFLQDVAGLYNNLEH